MSGEWLLTPEEMMAGAEISDATARKWPLELCEYNPSQARAAYRDEASACKNEATVCVGAKGRWHLCSECAALPVFRRLKNVTVVQITAPHYCAGADLEGGRVTVAADILGWMVRQAVTLDFIRSYVRAKRYLLTIHHPDGSWEYDP